jgi:hypothetical protein
VEPAAIRELGHFAWARYPEDEESQRVACILATPEEEESAHVACNSKTRNCDDFRHRVVLFNVHGLRFTATRVLRGSSRFRMYGFPAVRESFGRLPPNPPGCNGKID